MVAYEISEIPAAYLPIASPGEGCTRNIRSPGPFMALLLFGPAFTPGSVFVIEKPILELLRITPDTPFEIMSDGQCLVLTPVRDSKEEKKF